MLVAFATGAVAKATKQDVLKFDQDESTQTAEAISNVGQYYNVTVSPVAQAWMALGATVATIYAGKIAAIRLQRKSVAKQPEPVDADKVVPDMASFLHAAE